MVWEAMIPEPGKSTPTRQGVLYAELRGTLPGRYLRGGTFRGLKRLLLGRQQVSLRSTAPDVPVRARMLNGMPS
jgi:hypothetical protein